MEDIWKLLDMEPSTDTDVIKRAYARQTHKYHPEENPEMFLRLRKAYQAAMAYSEREQTGAPEIRDSAAIPLMPSEEKTPLAEESGWQLITEESKENPYRKHEAYHQFTALYTGSQRKNAKVWLDYFTSAPFLEVYRERAFAELLWEEIEKQEISPSREFLTWLHIAYLIDASYVQSWEIQQFRAEKWAVFDGIEFIYLIAEKGPVPKRRTGNELSMFFSFSEYCYLMRLAKCGNWNEKALADAREIFGYYNLAYLKEKCVNKVWTRTERHLAGVRLLNNFFECQTLPDELYRILWEQLSLKTATMGRTKIFYGRLREIVLERIPDIEAEDESFTKLYQEDVHYFSVYTNGADPQKDLEKTDAFMAREDLQRALRNRRFVEDYVLRIWLSREDYMHNDYIPDLFLERLIAFYRENSDAPCAARVIWQAEQTLLDRTVKRQKEEDLLAPVLMESVSVVCRPFFRHWLNTGFYLAKDPSNGMLLCQYLSHYLPYLEDWSRRFAQTGRRWKTVLEEHTIELIFHQRYMEYKVDSKLVCCPLLNWSVLTEKLEKDTDSLFLLLPVTAAPYDQYESVREELEHRLNNTAAPKEDFAEIAGYLAGHVCCLPRADAVSAAEALFINPEDLPASSPIELFAENEEHLYGCSWFRQEGVLLFFEQTAENRVDLPRGCYQNIFEEEIAFSMGQRLLEDIASPAGFNLSLLGVLPFAVHVQPRYAPAETVEAEEVTIKRLSTLIGQYAQDSLLRLQFEWQEGSLVFVRDENGYACFYFDDAMQKYFTLLFLPEVYETVPLSKQKYVPFGLGKLPDYAVHPDAASILCKLGSVFRQLGRGVNPVIRVGGHCLWDIGNIGNNAAHRYRLAKQKLGGYPAEQVQNYILAKFVISRYPDQMEKMTMEKINTDSGSRLLEHCSEQTEEVRLALMEFMQNKLRRLRLSWRAANDKEPYFPFHIVLLQEAGRYMMAYLCDDRQTAQYYVADRTTYVNMKGKNYSKEAFMGNTVPAYLIHKDACSIRNCLDLIFDDMAYMPAVLNQFAAFANENPAKPRAYEEIRAELVGGNNETK